MNSESSLKLQSLEKFPVFLTKEKVAEALGIATHNIPPLVRAGLLKPLGHPGRYCVKHFSRDALAEQFASQEWLNKVMAAIHRHWRTKNARKRPRLTGRRPMGSNGDQGPAAALMETGESVTR
jgi:hypothetical protein